MGQITGSQVGTQWPPPEIRGESGPKRAPNSNRRSLSSARMDPSAQTTHRSLGPLGSEPGSLSRWAQVVNTSETARAHRLQDPPGEVFFPSCMGR